MVPLWFLWCRKFTNCEIPSLDDNSDSRNWGQRRVKSTKHSGPEKPRSKPLAHTGSMGTKLERCWWTHLDIADTANAFHFHLRIWLWSQVAPAALELRSICYCGNMAGALCQGAPPSNNDHFDAETQKSGGPNHRSTKPHQFNALIITGMDMTSYDIILKPATQRFHATQSQVPHLSRSWSCDPPGKSWGYATEGLSVWRELPWVHYYSGVWGDEGHPDRLTLESGKTSGQWNFLSVSDGAITQRPALTYDSWDLPNGWTNGWPEQSWKQVSVPSIQEIYSGQFRHFRDLRKMGTPKILDTRYEEVWILSPSYTTITTISHVFTITQQFWSSRLSEETTQNLRAGKCKPLNPG